MIHFRQFLIGGFKVDYPANPENDFSVHFYLLRKCDLMLNLLKYTELFYKNM